MKRILFTILLLSLWAGVSLAQTRERLSGWCEQGAWQVTTDGRQSTTRVQRSYSSCTVTVYDAGTTNLADIASDYGGTPKSNPFTASSTGFWDFFGVEGRYDVRLSGSGISSPFTIPGLWIRTGGGGGGGAPVDATYVVMSFNSTLTAERKLTAGTNVVITDGGANSNVTISAAPTDPGNPLTSVQTNQGGIFYGDLGFLYDITTDQVSLGEANGTTGSIKFFNNSNLFSTTLNPGVAASDLTIKLFTSLPGSGSECVQISSTGQLSTTGSACSSGGGGIGGSGTVPQVAYFSGTTTLSSSPGIVFNTPTQATIDLPILTDGIQDANGNNLVLISVAASAVNYFNWTNAATGNAPIFAASGSDTNVNLDLDAKGTGEIRFKQAAYSIPVTLSDASTIATDASLTNRFVVTIGASRTLGNPTNAQDNQQIVWTVIQDGTGGWNLTFDTKFAFGAEITSCAIATGANKINFITTIYRQSQDKFYIVGCVTGY